MGTAMEVDAPQMLVYYSQLNHLGCDVWLNKMLSCLDRVERERLRRTTYRRDALVRRAAARVLAQVGLAQLDTGPYSDEYLSLAANHAPVVLRDCASENRAAVSLSHSKSIAAAGVAVGGRIGIDIEEPNRSVDWQAIAASTFSREECDRIAHLGAAEGRRLFFRLWTAKEAFAKFHGRGLEATLKRSFLALADADEACFAALDAGGRVFGNVLELPEALTLSIFSTHHRRICTRVEPMVRAISLKAVLENHDPAVPSRKSAVA